mgnify:CR=1 FL=1
MIRSFALSTLVAFAVAGAAAAQESHGHDDDHHVSELGGIRAVHAWTRSTDGDTALIFADIENRSAQTVVLTGGESALAEDVRLVGFQMTDGEPHYVALPEMPIGAGKEILLEPEGLALQLTGVKQALREGTEIEVELEFDTGHMDVHVEVGRADATRHSHAGHAH